MNNRNATFIVTDSGLGGLSVFAQIARQLRENAPFEKIDLIYFNAWPFSHKGYNHFPNMAAKAAVFNNAMEAMARFNPDTILIACNTLSIIYPFTKFFQTGNSAIDQTIDRTIGPNMGKDTGPGKKIPVTGIVDHGVEMIHEQLSMYPESCVVIFGTPTTIKEKTHAKALIKMGIAPSRIINQGCQNLAGKIEKDPFDKRVAQMIETNARKAAAKLPPFKGKVFAALCCTHFGYCSNLFKTSLATHTRQEVIPLNPNERMARIDRIPPMDKKNIPIFSLPQINMKILSRVFWGKEKIMAYEKLLNAVSPQTVEALKEYTWDRDLFQAE
jgi:glutamate racemase